MYDNNHPNLILCHFKEKLIIYIGKKSQNREKKGIFIIVSFHTKYMHKNKIFTLYTFAHICMYVNIIDRDYDRGKNASFSRF